MTRTSWPRAFSRRTTDSIGGVLPPPSQCAIRKRDTSPSFPYDPVDEPEKRGFGLVPIELQVAAQQLPQVHIRRGVERGHLALALRRRERPEVRLEDVLQPFAV